MCRLAAFPPGYSKESALSIMSVYGESNRDGVGIAYAQDGELVVKKWPESWESLTKKKVDIFEHMPFNGWTIAHVRAATHGEKTAVNTHPFIRGDWAVCHNGIYSGHELARALLTEMGSVFLGRTDSEVGAELISKFGPKRFPRFASSHDGTWLALNKNGELHVVVTGGSCDLYRSGKKSQSIIASSLSNESGVMNVDEGWLRFNARGFLCGGKYKMSKPFRYSNGYESYPRNSGVTTYSVEKQNQYEAAWDKKYGRGSGTYEEIQTRDLGWRSGSFD